MGIGTIGIVVGVVLIAALAGWKWIKAKWFPATDNVATDTADYANLELTRAAAKTCAKGLSWILTDWGLLAEASAVSAMVPTINAYKPPTTTPIDPTPTVAELQAKVAALEAAAARATTAG